MPDSTPPPAPPTPPRWAALASMVILGVGGLLFVYLLMNGGPSASRIRYDELERYVAEDRVEEVVFSETEVRGTFFEDRVPEREGEAEPGRRFVTAPLEDSGIVDLLREHEVRYAAEPSTRWPEGLSTAFSIGLTLLLLMFVFRMFAGRGGPAGAMSFGKSRGKLVQEADIDVTFDDVAGVEEAKVELQEVIDLLAYPDKFRRIGAKIPKGVLLVGPPGTGKTLLARAVAGEAGVPFISINGSEFVEMFVGVGAARVRDLFEQASRSAPCIVFIDELDALGRSRAAGGVVQNEERESTLNQLLVEMDGFAPHRAVILMAATNRPEVLDPALLRAGRFDRQILVDRPDRAGRHQILEVHSRKIPLAEDVDLEEVARRTPGFSGADLASLVNEAALLAARQNAEAVMMNHLSSALDRVVAGLAKKSRLVDEQERERVAYHEVGHALCAHLSEGGGEVHKISIIPRGLGALGFTLNLPDRERQVVTEGELRAKLRGLLGGRAAEEVIYGEPSTGAQNDLARATDLARAMVTEYGMSEALGPVHLAGEQPQFLRGAAIPAGRAHGQAVADRIDQEVRSLVNHALEEARAMLGAHRDSLETITRRLLETEQLEGEELEKLLADAAAAPRLADASA